MQEELTREQANGEKVAEGYAAKVRELEADILSKVQWARDIDARLTAEIEELRKDLDDRAAAVLQLEAQVAGYRSSRWVKLGRSFGLGPNQSSR